MKQTILLLCLLGAFQLSALAQPQDAKSLHEKAKVFMREGDYPNAVLVLNNALQQDPNNLEMGKDLAFTYYLEKDFIRALAVARPLCARTDADVQSYQILGMIYKITDERKEAEKLYKEGIRKFPRSGVLYNEYGEILGTKDGTDAIRLWEKGIEVDPNFSGNYCNACKYYYSKTDYIWSLLYGEIFVNLESYSKRTTEIKDLLEDGFKQLFANLEAQKKRNEKNPFITAYLNTVGAESSAVSDGVTARSLSILRARFVLAWFDKNAAKYPFRLFDYQRQLMQEGMFDAYNQWVFGASENDQKFEAWTNLHNAEYKRFIEFQGGRVFKLPPSQNYQDLNTK